MAIEAPNIYVAGAQLVGVSGSLAVTGSGGLVDESFARTSAGLYTVQLAEPVNPAVLVCTLNALTVGNAPLICHASAALDVDGNTIITMRCVDAAGAAADGANIMLNVMRCETDG